MVQIHGLSSLSAGFMSSRSSDTPEPVQGYFTQQVRQQVVADTAAVGVIDHNPLQHVDATFPAQLLEIADRAQLDIARACLW